MSKTQLGGARIKNYSITYDHLSSSIKIPESYMNLNYSTSYLKQLIDNNKPSVGFTVTLYAANWTNNQQTAVASGVTDSNNIIVSSSVDSFDMYTQSKVLAISQTTNSITFKCTTTPSVDIVVNVVIV